MSTLTNEIWLDEHQYRYSFYKHNSKQAPFGIFLMGTLQEIESVSFFSKKMAESLNLFVVEVPGTGLTEPLPATFSMYDQAKMLHRFITAMHIPSAHIMSISYSTPIAVELCCLWHGALSLAMCGGTPGVVPSLRPASMSLLADALQDKQQFAKNFIDGMTVKDPNIPRGKVIARSARQRILQHSKKQLMCFCENTLRLLTYQPSENVSTLHIPSLIFVGEKDPYVTVERSRELATLLPNCQFKIIPNADHLVHLEYPELTASLLVKLVKDEKNALRLNKVPEFVA